MSFDQRIECRNFVKKKKKKEVVSGSFRESTIPSVDLIGKEERVGSNVEVETLVKFCIEK